MYFQLPIDYKKTPKLDLPGLCFCARLNSAFDKCTSGTESPAVGNPPRAELKVYIFTGCENVVEELYS